MKFKDDNGKVTGEKTYDDYYEQDDPDEYRIVIVDHYKLFTTESGKDIRETIGKWSSDYAIILRNKYNYTIVGIQQQAGQQESNENMKLGKLKPTLDGLGENKSTQQDCDLILGLYSPYRYGIREYEGYDVTKFRDNIRFLEILAGREGGGGNVCPLYFDGAVNFFKELPNYRDTSELKVFYDLVARNRGDTAESRVSMLAVASLKEEKKNGKFNSCTWPKWFWQKQKLKKLRPK